MSTFTGRFDEWNKAWANNDIGFHNDNVLPDLLRHENTFLSSNCRVYVPLCGKTLDMIYLADKGHDVHGCEFVKKGVKDFFQENNLEYTTTKILSGNVVVYKAVSKKITIYQGDFFALKFDVIGKFDAIWDRGGFVAIDPAQRVEYAKVMKDLMAPDCKYLLNTFLIQGDLYQGPPHSISDETLQSVFGSFCKIAVLDCHSFRFKFKNSESVDVKNILLSAL